MTLAFIRAVKTMRMSGSPSPFTSQSSNGDNTPPTTVAENHAVDKAATQPALCIVSRRLAQKKQLWSLLRNDQSQAAPIMARSFIAWKGRNVASGSEKRKGKIEELKGKNRCLLPNSLSEVMWESHIL